MNAKQLVIGFFDAAQYKITALEGYSKLTNEEKKARLDEYVAQYFTDAIAAMALNPLFKWAIVKVINKLIPTITQKIFDLIKTRVDGITQIWTKDANIPKEAE